MQIDKIPVGDNPPESLNVIIEVPTGGEPVKYEFDKAIGRAVRRPHPPYADALSGELRLRAAHPRPDGDPLDALVISRARRSSPAASSAPGRSACSTWKTSTAATRS